MSRASFRFAARFSSVPSSKPHALRAAGVERYSSTYLFPSSSDRYVAALRLSVYSDCLADFSFLKSMRLLSPQLHGLKRPMKSEKLRIQPDRVVSALTTSSTPSTNSSKIWSSILGSNELYHTSRRADMRSNIFSPARPTLSHSLSIPARLIQKFSLARAICPRAAAADGGWSSVSSLCRARSMLARSWR